MHSKTLANSDTLVGFDGLLKEVVHSEGMMESERDDDSEGVVDS